MNKKPANRDTFAERYQSVLVPVIFEPWAKELIRRAALQDGEHILDLACGTGVVTREIANTGITSGHLAAVDHNADMLAVARHLSAQAGYDVEWVEADAGDLPFDDDQFDLAFCQQALQFFPDRLAALCELRRVMKTGGRLTICVQRELSVNPLLQAQAAALEKHVGPEAATAVRAICSLPDAAEICGLFEEAGLHEIEIESVSLTLSHSDGRAFAAAAMGGMHTGDKLSDLTAAGIGRAVDDFLDGLGEFFDGTALRFPHVSNVITARA